MIELRYKRRGECTRCGLCCANEDCKHLSWDGHKAVCLIHNQERPQRCVLFPQAPPIMIAECGFYFVDTWEEDRVVKCRGV